MLKINLSDKDKKQSEETILSAPITETIIEAKTETKAEAPVETKNETSFEPEAVSENIPPKKKRSGKLLLLLMVILLCGVFYMQKDTITGIVNHYVKKSVPEPAEPQPEPVSEPVKTDVVKGTIIDAVKIIGDIITDGVWITNLSITCDGNYKISGVSFSRQSIVFFADSLKNAGASDSLKIPEKAGSSESIYKFDFSGKISGVGAPEILDIVPADKLSAIADSLKRKSGDINVVFTKIPLSGKTALENEMPFEVTGTYNSIFELVKILSSPESSTIVSKIIIEPAIKGKPSDKIKASFELKMVPSI